MSFLGKLSVPVENVQPQPISLGSLPSSVAIGQSAPESKAIFGSHYDSFTVNFSSGSQENRYVLYC